MLIASAVASVRLDTQPLCCLTTQWTLRLLYDTQETANCCFKQHNRTDLCIRNPMFFSVKSEITELTPWNRVVFENLRVSHLVEKSLRILWKSRVHHRVHDIPPLVPFPIQINPLHIPNYIFWILIWILLSHLFLCRESGLFPLAFYLNPASSSPTPHTCHMPRPSHFCCFNHRMILVEEQGAKGCAEVVQWEYFKWSE